jgi:hypothetical protein
VRQVDAPGEGVLRTGARPRRRVPDTGSPAERRARLTDRRRGKTLVTPEVRSRWHRAHYWVRYGITEAKYNQMLADQGNACGICRTPFQGQRVCIDHDHACCPVPASGHTRSCGKCIRGLLCVRCNTWLGWMETYGSTVTTYLSRGMTFQMPPGAIAR